MRKTISIAIALCTLGLAGCDESTTIVQEPQIQLHSEIELNSEMPMRYEEFAAFTDPYGAFYVTSLGGGGGRAGGKATLEEAKAVALAKCKEYNPKLDCILYATKTP